MLSRRHRRWRLPAPLALLAMLGIGVINAVEAQVVGEVSPIGNVMHYVRSISPLSGPVGTDVQVWTDGLPANARFHVAFGEPDGCGYEICGTAQTNAKGELEATLTVKDWGRWDHFMMVMIFDEEFVPIASSDPFHVTTEEGLVQREGVVGTAWPGCPSLEGSHGVTYALVGKQALTLMATQGEELIVEGRIVEGACTLQYAIEVEQVMLPANATSGR